VHYRKGTKAMVIQAFDSNLNLKMSGLRNVFY
jgi:hypothetical protein